MIMAFSSAFSNDKVKFLLTVIVVWSTYYFYNFKRNSTDVSDGIPATVYLYDQPTPMNLNCSVPKDPKFYSQGNEDVSFYERFYKYPVKCNGTVLEMGALDGVRFSISKFYEDYLGWKSILIEADPNNFKYIRRNRPKSVIFNTAICRGKSIQFFRNTKEGAVGGIVNTMSKKHKQDWIPKNSNPVSVRCSRLKNILKGVNHIDLFILDVEGGEFEALLTMNWEISVDYWIVELDGTNENKDNAVRDILLSNGYKKVKWNIQQIGPDGGVFMNEVFSKKEIGKTVFAFVLFEDKVDNIISNTDLVSRKFPGWEVYIYYDETVDDDIINKLKKKPNTILIDMSNSPFKTKLLWNLLIASNIEVERYVICNNTSLLSSDIKAVVEKWIISKKKFLLTRDESSVSNIGYVWGGQHDSFPDMQNLLLNYEHGNRTNKYSSFLSTVVWSKAQHSAFIV